MSAPGRWDASGMRGSDRRSMRWPVLATVLLLTLLLGLTSALDRSAPRAPASTPPVTEIPAPLLDAPVRCTRADAPERLEQVRALLRPDGRLTSAIATACPRLMDGRTVTYVGEVVGDVLRRDGGAWVQINDDAYALEVGPFGPHRITRGFSEGLAVWLPDSLHEELGAPGRHGVRGAIVLVEGTLLRADPADGGGLNVRAQRLELLAPSVTVTEPLNRPLVTSAAIAALLALATWIWSRRRARAQAH